jgi:hypothetical protein
MNRRKITRGLNTDQVKALNSGWHHARRLGMPLNTFVTFRPLEDAHDTLAICLLFATLRNKLGCYARQRGFQPAFVWSIEANRDGGGLHLHVLIHIPKDHYRHFEATCLGWMPGAHEVDVRPAHQGTVITSDGKRHSAVSYVSKQMTPQAWYGRGLRRQPGGPVLGKRGGVSLTLDWKAQRAWANAAIPVRAAAA